MLAFDARDLVEHRGQRAARHRDVLDEGRAEPLHRGVHRPADRQQTLALVAVVGHGHRSARRAKGRRDRVGLDVGGRPVGLDRQLRGAGRRRVELQQVVHGAQGRGIHQLHDRGLHSRGGDGRGGLGGGPHVGEGRRDRADRARNEAPELQRRADDDAERPFGPDHERRQIEARHALHGPVAERQEPAVGEHEVDAENGIPHHSVLRAEQSAGAGGDVAADRRDRAARRVGSPPQTVLGECGVEVGIQDAGLDDGEKIIGAHLEDAVHPPHRQRDLAGAGVGAARETGPRSAGHDGRARLGRDAERLLDILDRPGVHDGEGETRMPRAPTCRRVPRDAPPRTTSTRSPSAACRRATTSRAASVTRIGAAPR